MPRSKAFRAPTPRWKRCWADPAVDVVYVSATNDRHHGPTLAAARAGKHVLCEKPLALTLADARAMVTVCHEAGVVLGTNHHLRNAVVHRALRQLLAEGAIGRPLAARVAHAVYLPPHLQGWRITRPEAGGGVALDITVHDADTLRFVLAAEATEVTAMTTNQGMAGAGLEDTIMGVIRFDSGLLAQFHDGFTYRHATDEFRGPRRGRVALRDRCDDPAPRWPRSSSAVTARRSRSTPVPMRTSTSARSNGFNAAVRGEGEPAATGDDGVQSLAIALAAREAATTGRAVPVATA